jgi:predicted RNA binding protein YcfA (HicA-like mRNA interferase family)
MVSRTCTTLRSSWIAPAAEFCYISAREQVNMMKVREIVELLHRDGWILVTTRGSHRQFKHSKKRGRVTVAGKPGDDIAPGTLNSILKQAGLKEQR